MSEDAEVKKTAKSADAKGIAKKTVKSADAAGIAKKTTKQRGDEAENKAAEYLQGLGYEILARNFHALGGELDIVARQGETLVFAEVKYRRDPEASRPAEAVGIAKRMKLGRAVGRYLAVNGGWDGPMRFDVIELCGEPPEILAHLENAFVPEGF